MLFFSSKIHHQSPIKWCSWRGPMQRFVPLMNYTSIFSACIISFWNVQVWRFKRVCSSSDTFDLTLGTTEEMSKIRKRKKKNRRQQREHSRCSEEKQKQHCCSRSNTTTCVLKRSHVFTLNETSLISHATFRAAMRRGIIETLHVEIRERFTRSFYHHVRASSL